MKQLLAFFTILLLIPFSKRPSADLEKFEEILGPEKSEILTKLTEDFENNFLAKRYPDMDLSDSYWNFMIDITQQNFPEKKELISEENEKMFISSGLFKEIYLSPDSVWIRDKEVITQWTYIDDGGKIKSYKTSNYVSPKDSVKIDSIIELEKKLVKFNFQGNYFKAIKVAKSKSPFIDLYYNYAEAIGSIVPVHLILQGIKDYNLDYTGPVERRVLVLTLIN